VDSSLPDGSIAAVVRLWQYAVGPHMSDAQVPSGVLERRKQRRKQRETPPPTRPLRLPVYAACLDPGRRRRTITIRAHPADNRQFQCFDGQVFLDLEQIPDDFYVQLNPIQYTNLAFPARSRVPVGVFRACVRRGPGDQLVVKPSAPRRHPTVHWRADRRRRAFTLILPACMADARPGVVEAALRQGRVSSKRKLGDAASNPADKDDAKRQSGPAGGNADAVAGCRRQMPPALPGTAEEEEAVKDAVPAERAAPAPAPAPAPDVAVCEMFECMVCEESRNVAQRATGLCRDPQHALCTTCVVAGFEATGKMPACPVPHCTRRRMPRRSAMVALFPARPDLHADVRRTVTIHTRVNFSPCPLTGAAGVVSCTGEVVKYHDNCPSKFRCNHCLSPLATPADACDCRTQAVKKQTALNPYFRFISASDADPPQGFGIARNFQIDAARMRGFFDYLMRGEPDFDYLMPCVCPGCSTRLHKTMLCNELTCPSCGTHVCNFCGKAEKCIGMVDHFSAGGCPRYDMHAALTWKNYIVHMRCPCTPACQNDQHDCTEPAHATWRNLMLFNRRVNWINGFLRALDPHRQALAISILDAEYQPVASVLTNGFVSSNGHPHPPLLGAV
jgi:hypothetical protein